MLNRFQEIFQFAQTLTSQGKIDQAAEVYLQAVSQFPESTETYTEVGLALQSMGRLEDAVRMFSKAVQLGPHFAEAHNALGIALVHKGLTGEAVAEFREVTQLRPHDPRGYNNLAAILGLAGRTGEAVATLRKALSLDPNYASGYQNLGNALKDIGDIDGAIACYDKAGVLDPQHLPTASNRLHALHFSPNYDANAIYRQHRSWGEQQTSMWKHQIKPHENDPSPTRRLRIGYLSPDFRQHVVGWNLRPLLRCHDRDKFEIFCYASVKNPDHFTLELQKFANHWRNVIALTDDCLADQIREDKIDILVDLCLHLDGHRLPVFARKPAPVQLTYLGYCSTTGLKSIDYRLSDSELDPPNADLSSYMEETIRLPRSYWCYEPGGPAPNPSRLPALTSGHITFGCMNNFAKASNQALSVWGQILKRLPSSRLILHGPAVSEGDIVCERIAQAGIPLDRLEIVPRLPWNQYVEQFNRIDIGLDPFPYSGGITSCDSLWMGVPIVTLRGATAVGRAGASILKNVGLPELIAQDQADYVERALDLAADLPRLIRLRGNLRAQMQLSPLMDAHSFAKDVEAAYQKMWGNWCGGPR
jgi:predicted O-linked N-acetylglucosamine transferase (SPINDLY family)